MPRTGDLGYELLQPPYTPPMMTLRSTVAGAVLLAAVSSCSSVSTASAPAVSQTSATTMSPSSSTENQGTPASSSLPTPSSSAALESPAESGAPDTFSSDDPRDAIFTKTLRDKGWAPAIADADLIGTVTDAQSVCTEMGLDETDADKKLGIQGNAMLTVSTYGVDQAIANKVIIFSAHTYCPEYEALVASYLS